MEGVAAALDEVGVRVAMVTELHLDPPRVCRVELSKNIKNNRQAAPLSVRRFLLLLASFACLPQPASWEASEMEMSQGTFLPPALHVLMALAGLAGRLIKMG